MLKNRIAKNFKQLRKWARKNLVSCYRLYDRDIPEIPLAVDLYEFLPQDIRSPAEAAALMKTQAAAESANEPGAAARRLERTFLKVFLYERPYEKPEEEERAWLAAMTDALSECLGVDKGRIAAKTRLHEKGGSQYAKADGADKKAGHARNFCGRVFENGSIFYVDLATYLDTGLFLDMRKARAMVKESAAQKRVLNLFCYTSSFSVAAAAGGAAFVQSVDLSNTYLDWSKENFRLNGFEPNDYEWTKADAIKLLSEQAQSAAKADPLYDIIILDPPTFSNSKSAQNDLDIKRDWAELCQNCLALLNAGGSLYFSTNSQRFKFDPALLPGARWTDITEQTIDEDFKQKKSHRMWLLQNAV